LYIYVKSFLDVAFYSLFWEKRNRKLRAPKSEAESGINFGEGCNLL